jgi:hypothetical protein
VRFALLVLSGCVLRDDTVTITLRDPARVSVQAAGTEILAEGSARGDVPAAAFVREPSDDAWVVRDGSALEAWCNACRRWKRRTIVDAPVLVLDGTPDALVRISDGQLHARYVFEDGVRGRRGWYPEPRFALDLVTPMNNVIDIHAQSLVSDRNGGTPAARRPFEISAMVFGGAYATGGLALAAFGEERNTTGVVAAGGFMIVTGAAILAFSLHQYRACSREPTCASRR